MLSTILYEEDKMMQKLLLLLIAATTLVDAVNFRPTSECKDTNIYLYVYNSTEEYFEDEQKQSSQMVITFGITCEKFIQYKEDPAILYNITDINATNVSGDIMANIQSDGTDTEGTIRELNEAFNRYWFSFVLVMKGERAGSTPAAYYDSSEIDEIVNIKKTLAASFQAKLDFSSNTSIETDPQSSHVSTYRFHQKSFDGRNTVSQTRTVVDSNVAALSAAVPNEEVDFSRTDSLTIASHNKLMLQSHGNVNMRLIPPDSAANTLRSDIPIDDLVLKDSVRAKLYKRQTKDNTFNDGVVTNYYRAGGTYSMKQTGIRRVVRKRSSPPWSEMDYSNAIESSLLATVNKTRKAITFMKKLREQLGDINDVLAHLHNHPNKTSIASKIETLVKMEAKYGTTPSHAPAVDDVIDYLHSLIGSKEIRDVNTRLLLYYILNPEGSLPAQMAIVESLENAVDKEEEENVLFYLAFMENPQPQTVARVEQLISDDRPNDPVLLAYSAMVPRASPQLQQRMTSFLFDRLPMAGVQKNTLINHILALGNTKSLSTKDYLLDYISHPDEAIQLTAIFALRSLLNDSSVQESFTDILHNLQAPLSHVDMIARALMYGAKEARSNHKSKPFTPDLIYSLVARASNIDDEGIDATIAEYLGIVNTQEALDILQHFNSIKSNNYNRTRMRRGEKWNDDSDEVYNLVEPIDERNEDVNTFNHHLSYIWGKKLGGNDINIQVAAGGFVGVADSGIYKVFGRAIAQANVYNRHINFIEFTLLRKKTKDETHTKIYANIMGITLKNYDETDVADTCLTRTEPLYEGKVYTIFDFDYSVFVYIGTLNFGVKATVQFTAGIELAICEGVGRITAGAYLTPGITFVVAASGYLEIIEIARAGITVDVRITYQLQPGVNTEFCFVGGSLSLKNCIGIYDQWKDSYIDLYAWYAWRGWCGWWFCMGNDAYRDVHQIPGLSHSWKLPESAKNTLLEFCDNPAQCGE